MANIRGVNAVAGVAYITVDGVNYDLAGEAHYKVSTVERETNIGQSGIQGYKLKYIPGMISGKIRDGKAVSVASFNAMDNVSVLLELANNKSISGRGMWTTEAQEVDTEEGTFEVKWEGLLVEEL